MRAPAITQVLAALKAAIESIPPTARSRVSFRAVDDSSDPRDLPADSSCERLFRVRFLGLESTDLNGGTIAPGLADRVARFAVEVTYPALERDEPPDAQLASDAELVQRAFRRGLVGTPVRRVVCSTSREDGDSIVLVHALSVAYRDQE